MGSSGRQFESSLTLMTITVTKERSILLKAITSLFDVPGLAIVC